MNTAALPSDILTARRDSSPSEAEAAAEIRDTIEAYAYLARFDALTPFDRLNAELDADKRAAELSKRYVEHQRRRHQSRGFR